MKWLPGIMFFMEHSGEVNGRLAPCRFKRTAMDIV
jgi:hypothetical protein